MVEERLWHPVLAADALASGPVAVRVLATDLVLWRDGTGAARALDDRCPHRGTRLSLGRLQQGRLECPYHGWQFEGSGRCVHVPAEPGFQPSAAQSACRRAVCEAHAMVWVRLDDAPDAALGPPDLPTMPPRRLVCGPYDVHTSAPRVVENFLDTAHFPFVHERSLGDRAHAQVPPYEVQADPQGRPGVASYRAWQPQSSAAAVQGGWVDYRYRVLGPYSAVLEKKPAADMLREVYALWVCPVEAQASRVWFTLWTSDDSQSDDALRNFQDAVFLQDRAVLESQQPRELPLDSREAPGPADRFSAAYRRYLRQQGITFGVCG
ncbi:MAG TPA: aromatic ring-hydroxylating dioxygenase subunit alpha [Burkholderiaceae bacterium]|nr:aromatic ring-hydroxylating dioxygenase subunit alpha [Burkholderiaceae bacterium]